MTELKDDYGDMESKFMEMAKEDEGLRKQLWESANPAKFAYDTAVKHQKLAELDNLDDLKEKMRAEVRAELEQEMKADQDTKAGKREALTPSLATGRSTSGLETAEEDDLDDVLTNIS